MSVFYTGAAPNAGSPAKRPAGPGGALKEWVGKRRNRPRWQLLRRLVFAGTVAFSLAPCAMEGLQLPVLVGFLFSLKADWPALLAAGAGCLGGMLFWQGAVLGELVAGVIGALLTVAALSPTLLWKKPWVQALLCALVTGALGLVFLLGGPTLERRDFLELGLRAGFAALAQGVFRLAGEEKSPLALDGALGLVVMGLSQILVLRVVDLGFFLGAALTCAGGSLPMALFCGLGMDLAGVAGVPMSAVLCLSALGAKALPRRGQGYVLPGVFALVWGVAEGSFDLVLPASLLLGGGAAALVRPRDTRQKKEVSPGETRLMAAAVALGSLGEQLDRLPRESTWEGQLFDQAAQGACQGCSRWQQCWEREAEDTYRLLAGALPALLAGETLPETFLHRCRRPAAFAHGVQQGLDGLRLRRQLRSRLEESRRAVARQYETLSRLLLELAMPQPWDSPGQYVPQVGHSSACALGKGRSGDRVAWFQAPQNRFYVLLCDGMGAGPEAAKAGQQALELLRGLLLAGMEPEGALMTLNDFYVLQEAGGRSTADLLELHLDTGRAALYKWGGAPSYWKHRQCVKVVGTAAPPPGLGTGEACKPEVIRLSMQRGQMLVLVSDGLAGEDLPNQIADFRSGHPQTLAEQLTLRAKARAEDDCTAVAVCLSSHEPGLL